MNSYTAETLIDYIRDQAAIPDTGALGFTDADILEKINSEMMGEVVPQIMAKREEFFVVTEEMTITSNQTRYRIPERASGGRLRDLELVVDSVRTQLDHIGRTERRRYPALGNGLPSAFFIEGQYIVLVPDVGSSTDGTLEVSYFFRPGDLVLSTETRIVSTVDTATKTVTLTANIPSGWTTANTFDVHSAWSGSEVKEWKLTASSVATNILTFTTEIDGSVAGRHPIEAGDYVCLNDEAALPGIPVEAQPLLAQAVIAKILEGQGDTEGLQLAAAKLQRQSKNLTTIIGGDGRVEGRPKIIRTHNSPIMRRKHYFPFRYRGY